MTILIRKPEENYETSSEKYLIYEEHSQIIYSLFDRTIRPNCLVAKELNYDCNAYE